MCVLHVIKNHSAVIQNRFDVMAEFVPDEELFARAEPFFNIHNVKLCIPAPAAHEELKSSYGCYR